MVVAIIVRAPLYIICCLILGAALCSLPLIIVNSKSVQAVRSISDELWEKRNEEGRCGKCNAEFTDSNPEFSGGMCQNCWAVAQC